MEIIPAVMPKNNSDLKEQLSLVSSFVDTIQLDLMDGEFVPEKTLPYNGTFENLDFTTDIELDLMVTNAGIQIDTFAELKPKRIILHLEAEDDLVSSIKTVRARMPSVEIGVALNISTPLSELDAYLPTIDFVQLMGIDRIGFQGQPFDGRILDHIRHLRKNHPELIISVDGGVNFMTAPKLIALGVHRLVIGSAILKSEHIEHTIQEFKSLE
ncbi:hypothetical protein COB64_03130 [Candidatus Wolfebacteria bacterium]|nr:MAG: hypothetical protein COB64_03130 [Candidatus Wolfebacteria bacterium]